MRINKKIETIKSVMGIIIFSGFNQRAVIAFLRTLTNSNLDFAIIAKSEDDDIFLSEYNHKVIAVRNSIPLQLEDLINSIIKVQNKLKASKYFIAPTTEALNRFILDNRTVFEDYNCKIPLVDKNIYELVSDKYNFSQLCSKYSISVPGEININEKIEFPIVAKPKKYFSPTTEEILSPVIIEDYYRYESFLENYSYQDYYFQQFINGRSIYLLYYFHRNGEIYKFSQENLIQQPHGKSMIAAISSDYHNSVDSIKYEKLFKDINFSGLVMIEVRLNKEGSYMIEANPRFWGPSQLFIDAKINLFEYLLHDIGCIPTVKKYELSNNVKYFWYGGITQSNKLKRNIVYHKYNEAELLNTLPEWLDHDVYRREDTMNIFKREIQE